MDKNIDRAIAAAYSGDYIDSMDLIEPKELTIKDLVAPNKETSADGRLIDKLIILFEETSRKFICCKTDVRVLKLTLGPVPSETWIGKKITIATRYLEDSFGEKNAPCTRVIPPNGARLPKKVKKFLGREKPTWGE